MSAGPLECVPKQGGPGAFGVEEGWAGGFQGLGQLRVAGHSLGAAL